MDKENINSELKRLKILNNISGFFAYLLCILIIIWAVSQMFYLIKDATNNFLLYILYSFLAIFCLTALIVTGRKLLKDLHSSK